MKRTLAIILTLVLLLGALPLTVSAADVDTAETGLKTVTQTIIEDFRFESDMNAIALKPNTTVGDYLNNLQAKGGVSPASGEKGWTVSRIRGIYDDTANDYLNNNDYPDFSHDILLIVNVGLTDDDYSFSDASHTYDIFMNGLYVYGDVKDVYNRIGIRLYSDVYYNKVEVNVAEPKVGDAPTNYIPALQDSSHMRILDYGWDFAGTGDTTNGRNPFDNFIDDGNYYFYVTIQADNGYKFSSSGIGLINGSSGGVKYSDRSEKVTLGKIFKAKTGSNNKCTVSFDSNGGTGSMSPVTLTKGNGYTLPSCGFTAPAGKQFDYWIIDGKAYNPNDYVYIKGDTVIKAKWKKVVTVNQIEEFRFESDKEAIAIKSNMTVGAWINNLTSKGGVKAAAGELGWEVYTNRGYTIYDDTEDRSLNNNEYPNISHDNILMVYVSLTDENYTFSNVSHTYNIYMNGEIVGGEVKDVYNRIGIRLFSDVYLNKVEVNVAEPKVGDTPTNYIPTLKDSSHMRITDYGWYFAGTGDTTNGRNPFDNFIDDGNYYFDVTIQADDGYKFSFSGTGLINGSSDGVKYSDASGSKEVTLGKIFKAKEGSGSKCTVTFDKNGGSGTMNPVTVNKGSSYKLPECGFTHPNGNQFKNWKIGSYVYNPGDTVAINSDTTVYAQWKGKYTITYDRNGGTGTMAAETYNEGDKYVIPACRFTPPSNMIFGGWLVDGKPDSVGDYWNVYSDHVLKPQWIPSSGVAERVDVSVTAPKAGEMPSYDVTVYGSGNVITGNEVPVSGSPGVYTQYKGVLWRDMTTRKNHRSNVAFVDGHEYRVSVDLKSLGGTKFNFEDDSKPITQIYINGSAAEIQPAAMDNNICTAMYTFSGSSGSTVSGTETSFLSDSETVTVQLLQSGSVKYSATTKGKTASYSIPNVANGAYTLRVSKKNHVTRDYAITVSGDTTQDVKIHPLGDINGDGAVNNFDYGRVNSHARSKSTLTDYEFLCGDINNDGNINNFDVGRINSHARGKSSLWT